MIAVPHPYTGEAVKAFVVPRDGAALQPEDVTAHAATRLARFKRPTIVTLVAALPHSATGKVAKGRLRERRAAVTGPGHPDRQARLPPLRRGPGGGGRVTAELGLEFDELSILDDPDLQARYWEQIPVTLVDGEQHDFWRVSESRLRAALGA